MGFSTVRLYQFRNLVDAEVAVSTPQVFLIGENGQGKTNFLESIYLLCFGASFRTRAELDLIRHGQQEMAITGIFGNGTDGAMRAEAQVDVRIRDRKKSILADGKQVRDRKELIERLPGIVFCHEDISFVSGPPERRRWFFNQAMSLSRPLFVDLIRRYTRVIRMRNGAIKSGETRVLEVFDEQAASAGVEIQKSRAATTEEFNRSFTEIFRHVSGMSEPVSIKYAPSWRGCETIDDALVAMSESRERDQIMQTSTTGPHRDRFVFVSGGKNFARTASTGQLRLLSLVLRVAQAVHFSQTTSALPILMLDDVLLELDGEKRKRFVEVLPPYEQAFFTFLPDERYDPYRKASTTVYRVTDGALTVVEAP